MDADLTNLPNQIFEAFLPGYSIISKLLLQIFGIDASRLIPSVAITVAVVLSANYLYRHAYRLVQMHLTACVVIESGDDFYEYVTAWISSHPVSRKTRSLKVRNGRSFVQEGQIDVGSGDSQQETGYINLKNWEAKLSPHFEPLTTSGWFWHNGRYFQFTMSEKTQSMREGGGMHGTWIHHKEQVTIVVLGRSPQPIKDLLLEAREIHLEHRSQMTTIRRPVHARMRYYDDLWQKIASRPSRPLDTVVLNRPEKQKLLADVNEYLQPATRQWYAERGIPYRRGYLLYGPPGTGKTSLSFALAGVFGVDIYSLSLLDPSINDEDVNSLMSALPKHCIILLEDIDSAGLKRGDDEDEQDSDNEDGKEKSSGNNKSKQDKNKRISLSGLLNAIDGVASHEGRILIMTTNNPELLDPALTRPGRVDMKIEFTLSSREQIKELFLRMYSGSKLSSGLVAAKGDEDGATAAIDLEALGSAFAEKLPEQVLSPAEVMGYLLLRKKGPQRAVAEAEAWRDEVLEEKAVKQKK